MRSVANFLFEMWMLQKQQRTWFAYLWSGSQSIADHVNRVCYIGFALAHLDGTVDPAKVVMMCLFHDMAEARSLDHNYTAQAYVTVDEDKIVDEQTRDLPFGNVIKDIVHEYETRESQESLLAKDADYLELFLKLKEEYDTGNQFADKWMKRYLERMRTDAWKKLMQEIYQTPFYERWNKAAIWTLEKKDNNNS
jgi:putative hydrolases of HD superfamily